MEYVLQWYVLHVSLIIIGDIWSTYDKWGVVTDHTEWRRKYFPAICSTCLSSATPELDQFRLGWPKNQFPDVRSGTKSRSRSLFTKTLPGSPRLRLGPRVPYLYSFVGRSGAWTRFSNESHENFSSLPCYFQWDQTENQQNAATSIMSLSC